MWSYITTHHIIPHHTIPYNIIPHNTIPNHIIPQNTIPHNIIPHNIIPHHTISYHTTPYHTKPYHTKPHPNLQRSFSKSIFADIIYHIYQIQRVPCPRQSWADKYWKRRSQYWNHRILFCQILEVNRNMK